MAATSVERRFTNVPVETRATDKTSRIGGYAAMFGRFSQNLGGFVEVIEPSFFNKSRGDGWPDVLARYNHDDNLLLGTTGGGTLSLTVDDTGLLYDVELPQARADVFELVRRGDVRKSSFAFTLPPGGDEWTMTDQEFPLRRLITGRLIDVAPVNTPAYTDTTTAVRSLADKMQTSAEEVRKLADQGELRRFFQRTDNRGKPTPAKPRTLGAAAAVQLLARRTDPWDTDA